MGNNRYVNIISQITGLTEDKVEEVFKYYKLLILNDICNRDKEYVNIELPCFCSLNLSSNDKKLYIRIPYNKQRDIYPELYNAFFFKKNPILDNIMSDFSKQIKNEIYGKVDKSNER